MIFHLLSSDPSRGHRTHVSRVPFESFSITFSDASRVAASRPNGNLVGDYLISIGLSSGASTTVPVVTDPDTGRVTSTNMLDRLSEALAALDFDIIYLADTRELQGDSIPPINTDIFRHGLVSFSPEDALSSNRERLNSALADSVVRVNRWLHTETLSASSIGETDAQQSYADIVRTIASTDIAVDAGIADVRPNMRDELTTLEDTSRRLSQFGLMSAVDSTPFLESLEAASSSTLPLVIQVLRSFLDGQRSRLNALGPFYVQLANFVSVLNGYFTGKSVRLHVSDGFQVLITDGALQPESLSSGEKHLLMLLLNVLVSKDRSPLFIIDEPELSLNVKWQRNLVTSLLELSGTASGQFLMATHSIELLSHHSEYVIELNPRE